jgi:hypothetical protein
VGVEFEFAYLLDPVASSPGAAVTAVIPDDEQTRAGDDTPTGGDQTRRLTDLTATGDATGTADLPAPDLLGSDLLGSDLLGPELLGSDLLGSDLHTPDLLASDESPAVDGAFGAADDVPALPLGRPAPSWPDSRAVPVGDRLLDAPDEHPELGSLLPLGDPFGSPTPPAGGDLPATSHLPITRVDDDLLPHRRRRFRVRLRR